MRACRKRSKTGTHDPVYGVARVSASSIAGLVNNASSVSYHPDSKNQESPVVMNRFSTGLVRNSSHLCFDNPYYDVMTAMAIDDDVDGDFINPLYNQQTWGSTIRNGL